MTTMLDYALAYALRGWPVFPLAVRDKVPLIKGGTGCLEATTDETQIRKWWGKTPLANIGLATGHSFFVIDIDPRHNGHLWQDSVDLPDTITQQTGSGGTHYIYAGPPSIPNSNNKISPGVDIRGQSGYIVAAPSIHPNGKPYVWVDTEFIPTGDPQLAPGWLLDMAGTASKTGVPPIGDVIKHGDQHETLWKYACSLWGGKVKYTEAELVAAVTVISKRCEIVPPEKNVEKIVYSVTRKHAQGLSPEYAAKLKPEPQYVGQAPQQQPEAKTAAPATVDLEVADAIARDDMAAIWNMLQTLAAMPVAEYQINRAAIKAHFKTRMSLSALDEAIDNLRPTEDDDESGNVKLPPNKVANEILKKHHLLNVCDNLYEYDGKKWTPTASSRLHTLALQQDGEFVTTKQRRAEIVSFIASKIYTNKHEWRQIEIYEVPVANGVIDIRTMEMRPHRKEDYLQTCIPWAYSAKAQCPVLMRCLDTYFGKDDDGDLKIAALQEFFGYCLMPHARYKKALLCVGESDCGKSTIPYLLRQLLGSENICAVSVEHMDDERKRAPLLGKLVNLLTELTSDAMIADGGFKTLVSIEEPILFDPKHLAPVMDTPISKHVIVTNKKPRINDKSNATFRRLLLIHFNFVIPASEQDTTVWDQLKEEIDGILSWALEGAQRLHANGGRFSDPGAEEIREYKNEQNPMLTFLEHYCERDQHAATRTSVFIDRFKQSMPGKWSASIILDLAREAGLVVEKNPTSEGAGAKYRHVKGIRIT